MKENEVSYRILYIDGERIISEEGEPIVYPYPLLDNQMVEALLETSEWSNIDE